MHFDDANVPAIVFISGDEFLDTTRSADIANIIPVPCSRENKPRNPGPTFCTGRCPTGALLNYLKFHSRSDRLTRRDWLALGIVALALCLCIA